MARRLTQTVTVALTEEEFDILEKLCQKEERGKSWFLRRAFQELVERRQANKGE